MSVCDEIFDYIAWARGLDYHPLEIHISPELRQKLITEMEHAMIIDSPATHREQLFGLDLIDDLMPEERFKLKLSGYPDLV